MTTTTEKRPRTAGKARAAARVHSGDDRATAAPPEPTEAAIRGALMERLEHPTDDYARDDAWIDYLSDGLNQFFPPRTDEDGDSIESHQPALEVMIEVARPAIAARAHQVAIDELTRIGLEYSGQPRSTTSDQPLADRLRSVIEEVAIPALAFVDAIGRATELEDDSECAARVRQLVQANAAQRLATILPRGKSESPA